MKRVLFSAPVGILTFLVGLSTFLFVINAYRPFNGLSGLNNDLIDSVPSPMEPIQDLSQITSSEADDIKAVYTVVLKMDLYNAKRIILEENSERGGAFMDGAVAQRDIAGSETATIENYELRNKVSSSLRDFLSDRKDIVFFTLEDGKAFDADKNTPFEDKFEKRFPGSHHLISLSSVGFNRARTEALIYVSYYCGSLCAGGSFIVLNKVKGEWLVTKDQEMWVS